MPPNDIRSIIDEDIANAAVFYLPPDTEVIVAHIRRRRRSRSLGIAALVVIVVGMVALTGGLLTRPDVPAVTASTPAADARDVKQTPFRSPGNSWFSDADRHPSLTSLQSCGAALDSKGGPAPLPLSVSLSVIDVPSGGTATATATLTNTSRRRLGFEGDSIPRWSLEIGGRVRAQTGFTRGKGQTVTLNPGESFQLAVRISAQTCATSRDADPAGASEPLPLGTYPVYILYGVSGLDGQGPNGTIVGGPFPITVTPAAPA